LATETVNILGRPVKKNTAVILGIAGAGVIAVAVYRKKKTAAGTGSTTAAAGAVTDPDGNSCASLNPATGYCPGTPGDIAAQQAASAYAGGLSGGVAAGGASYFEPTGTSSGATVPVFLDNGSWAQYAEQALGSNGADAIAAAIAKYLSGQAVTSDQQTIIEEAIAIANYPPVPGSAGFPPSVKLTAGGSTATAGTSSTAKPAAPGGVHAKTGGKGDIAASWNTVAGASSYHLRVTHQGSDVTSADTTGTSHTITGLKTGISYGVRVAAVNSAGQGPYGGPAYAYPGK
jgi:fibronectin type III domain protein